jgi:hypothetical protein
MQLFGFSKGSIPGPHEELQFVIVGIAAHRIVSDQHGRPPKLPVTDLEPLAWLGLVTTIWRSLTSAAYALLQEQKPRAAIKERQSSSTHYQGHGTNNVSDSASQLPSRPTEALRMRCPSLGGMFLLQSRFVTMLHLF